MRVVKLLAVSFLASTLTVLLVLTPAATGQSGPTEAPAAFDDQTNGFEPQGDPNTPETFLADKAAFEAREEVADGLGPVYNAQSCAECHQNRVTGGNSQVMELRAGHTGPGGAFVPAPGGSLIQSRAIEDTLQERVPDGARIVYKDDANVLHVMGADGGQYGTLGDPPVVGGYPSFSPDGTKIAFDFNSSRNIFVINSDGTNLQQLTSTGNNSDAAWSPDGTKIAFTSNRAGGAQLFTMNADGTNQTNISNAGTFIDSLPSWSPDGTKIAFNRAVPGTQTQNIWTMNEDGTGQAAVTAGPFRDERPTWSPDATMIAFHSNRDGNLEIYKMPSIGGLITRLTNNPAVDANPAWAPNNSAIAFTSLRSGSARIWTMETNGSRPSQISATTGDQAAYSRDQGETIRTFRASPHILGSGFVEATDDSTLLAIQAGQPVSMRGTAISVPLLEASGQTRLGRFGWKNSVASLLSFSAGAYLAEMGITSPLQPAESTSLGRSVTAFDLVPDVEDGGGPQGFGEDVEAFARFMRSTKAPPRDRALVPTDAADPGSALFDQVSCSVCHVRNITTAPVGTVFNGGTFVVPLALGNKVIHPFGDFLLHDIGTGDGIVETNGELTRNKVRTAPRENGRPGPPRTASAILGT
jgi:mono/diheme cytochrome c family protein